MRRERRKKKKKTVGEFRWMWCGDGAGKKGNWKREARVWFWGFLNEGLQMGGSRRGMVLCVLMCVCAPFASVEADRHKHDGAHCPAPSLCLACGLRGPHRISVSCVGVCGSAVIIDPVKRRRAPACPLLVPGLIKTICRSLFHPCPKPLNY